MSSRGSGKNFLYRFDVDLSQNFVKKSHVNEQDNFPGASHCDELPYLFKTGADTKIPSPSLDSKEFEMITTMVETFTAFANSGKPNNAKISEWEQVEKNTPFKCMNINQDKIEMIDLPENSRVKVWNEIFEKENVKLY